MIGELISKQTPQMEARGHSLDGLSAISELGFDSQKMIGDLSQGFRAFFAGSLFDEPGYRGEDNVAVVTRSGNDLFEVVVSNAEAGTNSFSLNITLRKHQPRKLKPVGIYWNVSYPNSSPGKYSGEEHGVSEDEFRKLYNASAVDPKETKKLMDKWKKEHQKSTPDIKMLSDGLS